MFQLEEMLAEHPVIAAIRNREDLKKVLNSDAGIVFVLYGSILDIKETCDRLREKQKAFFIHVDMIEGLKGDAKGIEFVKQLVEPTGIITTKASNIRYAMELGLCTIQRIFIIDSQSLQTGIHNVHSVSPDAVEVMPGVASKIINIIQQDIHVPIIAGGLINTKKDVMDAISAGAMAVSTSQEGLWNLT